jgi:hypothetical protein
MRATPSPRFHLQSGIVHRNLACAAFSIASIASSIRSSLRQGQAHGAIHHHQKSIEETLNAQSTAARPEQFPIATPFT